jgi:lipoate-protein ligase A
VHGEYEVPGGDLVVVHLDVEEDVLRNVRVAGDFFLEPDEAILSINAALDGAPSATHAAELAARIAAALPKSTMMLGLTAEGVGIAVRRALAHATEWSDYDRQLVHEEPQAPALHGRSTRCSPSRWPPGGEPRLSGCASGRRLRW